MATTDDKRELCANEEENRTADLPLPPSYPYPTQQYQHATQYLNPQHNYNSMYPPPPISTLSSCPPMPNPPPSVLPYDLTQVMVVPFFHAVYSVVPKSLAIAVMLCIPLLGMFGTHHFYLNNVMLGCVYACTCGVFGIGWIVDWFRLGRLVRKCNEELKEAAEKGHWLYCTDRFVGPLRKLSLVDAYLMWFPPFGWFGTHHFYLGRTRYGLIYAFTFGLAGVGWVFDLFRMPCLVKKANEDIAKMKRGITVEEPRYSVLDAYLCAFPLGLLGLHHFYLGNTKRGVLFLCTLGVFGLGWLADMFQMPLIVSEANKEKELRTRLAGALGQQQNQTPTTTTVVVVPGATLQYPAHATNMAELPPAYVPAAAAGEVLEKSGMPPP